jgi:hypothetical protein
MVTSLRFVHCRPPESTCFDRRRYDIILETVHAVEAVNTSRYHATD